MVKVEGASESQSTRLQVLCCDLAVVCWLRAALCAAVSWGYPLLLCPPLFTIPPPLSAL